MYIADKEEMKDNLPAAFRKKSEGGDHTVSKHYKFMTTEEIMALLKKMHWDFYTGTQQKSKKNPDTAKHMLRFRSKEYGELGVNGNVPEILLVNSHDRTSSLTFHVGIFRIICANGLVVASDTFDKFTVRHMGTEFDTVKEIITDITGNLPDVFKLVNKFGKKKLTEADQRMFAAKSMAIRFPDYVNEKTGKVDIKKIEKHVNIDELLKPLRPEDAGDSLWNTYNRVQEKMLKGGFDHIGKESKARQARPISNIRMNLLINKGMWNLAETFLN